MIRGRAERRKSLDYIQSVFGDYIMEGILLWAVG